MLQFPSSPKIGRTLLAAASCVAAFATPLTTHAQAAEGHEAEIQSLIDQMTLDEKLKMIRATSSFTSGGVGRLGIRELVMSDGPHGVRHEHGRDMQADAHAEDRSTYLPVGICLASTWNPELGHDFGNVLGSEARYRRKDVILGPGVNIIRTPLNGRNFEYLSEDPYLSGEMAVGYIQGVQQNDVAACVKHYLANNQETNRGTVDVQMSDRALHEIYLPAFKKAVQEGHAYSLMGAYNRFRGQFATHNEFLINDLLKGELGFDGVVISDWGAAHDPYQSLAYGLDIEMGSELKDGMAYEDFYIVRDAKELIDAGRISEDMIDDKVERILRLMYRIHKLGDQRRLVGEFNSAAHQQTARKVAAEGIVLLKNEGGLLPLDLSGVQSIAVIGANADHKHAEAGGSSQVPALYEITPLQGIREAFDDQVQIDYFPGYAIAKGKKPSRKLRREAVKAARDHDLVIFVGGFVHGYDNSWGGNAFDAEAGDKPDMHLPFGQDELIHEVSAANPHTVLVLYGGGAADMTGWVDQIPALVQAWYPGMEGGHALADILSGQVNPSGKLPVTFPKVLEDSGAHALGEYPGGDSVQYKDDIFVGYRYADTYDVAPQFPFGHGLSYTTFNYAPELHVSTADDAVTVETQITNTGDVAGAEVVQLYVSQENPSIRRPAKELKGFQKVFLQPGESQTVTFTLHQDAFSAYHEDEGWVMEPDTYRLQVGSSSRDLRASAEQELEAF